MMLKAEKAKGGLKSLLGMRSRFDENELENFVLLLGSISQQTSYAGFVSVCLLWAKTNMSESMVAILWELLNGSKKRTNLSAPTGYAISTSDVGSCVSEEEKNDSRWTESLRGVFGSWSLIRNNPIFEKMCTVINCVVTMGLCDAANVTFRIKDYLLFSPHILKRQITCFDAIDACIELVDVFTKALYACFARKSLRPLILGKDYCDDVDEEFLSLLSDFAKYRNGNMLSEDLGKNKSLNTLDMDHRIKQLISKYKDLMRELRGIERKVVMDRLQQLVKMETELYDMTLASGLRHAPWAMEVYGESNQGKTTFTDQLVTYILLANNMDSSYDRRCTVNLDDKYMSTWTSDKIVMNIDDLGNTNSNFVTEAPTRKVIDVINNAPYYATKAEIEAKGRCLVMPWLVTATTNVKNLNADVYSVHPISIQRRFVCFTIAVKKEFALVSDDGHIIGVDSAAVLDKFGPESLLTDIWDITVERAVPSQRGHKFAANYEVITWSQGANKLELRNVGIKTVAMWAAEQFRVHKLAQEKIVRNARKGCKTFDKCKRCMHEKDVCALSSVSCCERAFSTSQIGPDISAVVEEESTIGEVEANEDAIDPFIAFIANSVMDVDYAFTIMGWCGAKCNSGDSVILDLIISNAIWSRFKHIYILVGIYILVVFFFLRYVMGFGISVLTFSSLVFAIMMALGYAKLLHAVSFRVRHNMAVRGLRLSTLANTYMRVFSKECLACVAGFVSLLAYYKYIRKLRDTGVSTGLLSPNSEKDIEDRDQEVNVYATVKRKPLQMCEKSRTTDSTRLMNTIRKNLCHATIEYADERTQKATVLFLRTGVFLLPAHYMAKDEMRVLFKQEHLGYTAFHGIVSLERSIVFEECDMCICSVSTGGSFKDITEYIVRDEVGENIPFVMNRLDRDGTIHTFKASTGSVVKLTTDIVHETYCVKYKNYDYMSQVGDCGSPLVSDGLGSALIGIHIAGLEGKPGGFCVPLHYGRIMDAIELLMVKANVISHADVSEFRDTQMGCTFMVPGTLHKKSPLNYMPEGSSIEYRGECIGRSTFRTRVECAISSPAVVEVCGVPNIYRGPIEKPQWKPWQDCLAGMALPGRSFEGNILNWCITDYSEPLLRRVKESPDLIHGVLTDQENMCGVPGKRFLDAIKVDTSMGFPFQGKKESHLEVNEVNEHGDLRRVFKPNVLSWISEQEELLSQGLRCNFVAKACRKDEVVNKEKGRIFFSANVGLIYLVRKYFLPVSRFIQTHPLLSECAVGINAEGPEWHQLHGHITYFGVETIVAGDYKKYDQRLPSQLIEAALSILIRIAETCGKYSARDLRIMHSLATEIIYPFIAYDGSLISTTEGTHVSGNPLTVIINSIVGSLNMRYALAKIYPGTVCFRDVVKLITYGDDNIASVHGKYPLFNIENIANVLHMVGQELTMPDKSLAFRPYLKEDEIEFLKRRSQKLEDIDCYVGALDEASIFKRLHCVLREKSSPLSARQLCAVNIDTAIRDWFFHGRERYDLRVEQMRRVADQCDVAHMCNNLHMTYDDWKADWLSKYQMQLETMHLKEESQRGKDTSSREQSTSPLDVGDYGQEDAQLSYTHNIPFRVQETRRLRKLMEAGERNNFNKFAMRNYIKGAGNWASALFNTTSPSAKEGGDNTLPTIDHVHGAISTADVGLDYDKQSGEAFMLNYNNASHNDHVDAAGSTANLMSHQAIERANLSTFMQRTVKLRTFEWQTGSAIPIDFNPWADYFDNPVIKNKLLNHNLLRCKLRVRFLINANSTFWGRLMIFYNPLPSLDQGVLPNPLLGPDIIAASKRPHVILDATDSNGASIELPFFWHKDYLNVPRSEWRQMGTMQSYVIAPLVQANNQSDTISITVMAEAVDVELSGMTSFAVSTSEVSTDSGSTSMEFPFHDVFVGVGDEKLVDYLYSAYSNNPNIKLSCTRNCTGYGIAKRETVNMELKSFRIWPEFDSSVRHTRETHRERSREFDTDKVISRLDSLFRRQSEPHSIMVRLKRHKYDSCVSSKDITSIVIWYYFPNEDLYLSDSSSLDCEVGVSTSEVSSEVDEANRKGVISGPATAAAQLAGIASKFSSKMGYIALTPYVKATEMGLRAIAGMAKLLGYSRPYITKEPDPYYPKVTGNLAVTTVPVCGDKLTVDDKQELTIDPSTVGLKPYDNLQIANWARRENIFTVFEWDPSNAVDDMLFNMRINPCLFRRSGTIEDGVYHLTSLCEAALPFSYWTGTINVRFSVICSKFHVGRLLIKYDPNYDSSPDPVTGVSQILDIQGGQNEYCFSVKNNQERALLRMFQPGIDDEELFYSTTTAYTAPDVGRSNGTLTVRVLNRLTLLNTSADNSVKIMVSVSAGDDFAVFEPNDRFMLYEPAVSTSDVSADTEEICNDLMGSGARSEHFSSVYMGERIISMRPLLKRFSMHRRDAVFETTDAKQDPSRFSFKRNAMPLVRGAVANAVDVGGKNLVNFTLLNYVASAHAGWRGSVRYKLMPQLRLVQWGQFSGERPNTGISGGSYVAVERTPIGDNAFQNSRDQLPDGSVASVATSGIKVPGGNGSIGLYNGGVVADSHVNPSVSFEVPFYSPFKFSPGRQFDYTTSSDYVGGYKGTLVGSFIEGRAYMDTYVSAGEDFSPLFYVGMPPIRLAT